MSEEDTPKRLMESDIPGREEETPPLKPANVKGVTNFHMDRAMRALMESYIGRIPPQQRVASVRRAWQELWYRASRYLQKEDLMQMGDAFVYAAESHGDQLRYNSDPYIVHTLGAASVLSDMQLDVQTLIAALLHDVIEDTLITPEDLGAKFGEDVLTLVDGVTKLGKLPFKNVEDYQAENLRKMFLVMAKDIRVVLIKLADRLHNMSTITGHKREKQIAIANETLEIYAPLAHRLGIYHIKRELEDMSFKVTDPEMYYDIRRRVRKKMPESENVLKKGMEILRSRLDDEGVHAEILGRPKHYYSIYEKMKRKNLSLDQIYDLLALRVIVNSLAECYQVLGIVHTLWKPIPGQFDDYIANPKGNMYQSLHSTVVGPDGDPLEVQIRTWEMHRLAEYGIAAHWQYKEKKNKLTDMDIKLSWIRQALESQGESEPSDFLDHLKTDVLSAEVFVFTPQGMVISVPNGSTPIDFAYAVHTEIGHKCVGSMVNGRIVPMDYILQNGDIVRILTSPQGKPSRDWLKIAKSNRTRNKIRSYFRQIDRAERESYLERGRELLEREASRRNLLGNGLSLDSLSNSLSRVANDLTCSSIDDLIISVGNAHHSAQSILSRVESYIARDDEASQTQIRTPQKISKEVDSAISVEGAEGVLVSLSMCCCPVPGDKITGCVTQSRGITVHRYDCANLEKAPPEKRVLVNWGKKRDIRYTARIRVEANDRVGVFADLGAAISQTDGLIANIRGAVVNGTRSRFVIEIQVWDLEHLYRIIARINLMNGIIETTRG
ncbi:MAG: bifunctional (p)ppGpp synthetase/guanosine-3',5'-bis(diphosphate) 3'-pyrophosphohydrolase [Synergistaceae bacterium]|jgi:GTP pyrophosphokinase|nr:bifunctional (p)ppGpp synthetase/guanosine-3',5'-bis(diphosphate) 3'-pyrophosphohydrolase [Synergistaceae bacterium]